MEHRFSVKGDFLLEVGQAKKAIQSVQGELNNLNMPDKMTKGIDKRIDSLVKKLQDFEVQASKDLTSTGDSKQLEKMADGLIKEWERLKLTIKDTARLSNDQLEQMFPKSVIDTLNAARSAITNYNTQVKNNGKDVAETNGKIAKSMTEVTLKTQELTKAQEEYNKLSRDAINSIQKLTGENDLAKASDELDKLIEKAKQWNDQVNSGRNASGRKYNYADSTKQKAANRLQNLENLKVNFDAEKSQIEQYEAKIDSLKTKIDDINTSIQNFQTRLAGLTNIMNQANGQALTDLFNALQTAGVDTTGFAQTLDGATAAIQQFQNANADAARNGINNVVTGMQTQGQVFDQVASKAQGYTSTMVQMDQRLQEVQSIKSRIQYFFGLNNTIMLVRRGIHQAIATIKELDAAMTETAVVTDFTVGDMWKQLSEYTKRANQLGVSTKAAYEAATLYYQQGLRTNEVNALSVETLKMARIAGLEAADATDRRLLSYAA